MTNSNEHRSVHGLLASKITLMFSPFIRFADEERLNLKPALFLVNICSAVFSSPTTTYYIKRDINATSFYLLSCRKAYMRNGKHRERNGKYIGITKSNPKVRLDKKSTPLSGG